ncbi:MAG: hypothetical protein J5850_04435 [Clostridia bacterium]|nr:hypothetical protein [Clostridia bacterium]
MGQYDLKKEEKGNPSIAYKLAWLEHRRWCAYLRTEGFRYGEKNELLRKHWCLVESDRDIRRRDLLDEISERRYAGTKDFKENDYPEFIKDAFEPESEKQEKTKPDAADSGKSPREYDPHPADTGGIVLPESLTELTEEIAENVHDVWAEGRIKEGWKYGEVKNSEKKETPLLIPYAYLQESEKEYDRRTALETVKLIIAKGYKIKKRRGKGRKG